MGDGVTRRELLAVAADDQQRVVDPRAEAEHHAERGREAREVGERGAEAQQQDAAGERDQARDQRQQHRGDAAEDEREDDDRDREPDQLADGRGHLLGLVDDRAAARHLEAGLLADRRDLGEALAGRALQVLRGLVVLDGEEADPLDRGRAAAARRRSRAAGARRRAAVCAIAGVVLQRPALGGEDERRGVAGLRREALGEQVDRLLGLRAGRAEAVDEGAAAGADAAPMATRTAATIARERFQCPAAAGGETSKCVGHALQGITLWCEIAMNAELRLVLCLRRD